MKKQSFLLISIFVTLLAFSSCIDDDGLFRNCERGEGPVVEQVLDISEFTGVDLKSSADVFITQGPVFEVVAKGEANIIDQLELDVKNDIWDIEFDDCVKDFDLEIFITMPDINYLEISGSGDMTGDNFFTIDDITLRISGSGDICLGLFAESIDGRISGSGDMDLEGEATFMDFDITGSGDVNAFNLLLDKADIFISGSGNASLNVEEELRVRISGSGDVFFKGDPVLDIEISGSGDIVDAN